MPTWDRTFKEWADVYFDPEGNHVNVCIVREEALEDFVKSTKTTRWTTNKFTKSLKSYCAYNGYTLNPKDLQNSQGRITRKIEGTPKDMIYVKTKTIDPVELTENNMKEKLKEDDKPF